MSQKRPVEEGEEPAWKYMRIRLASPSPERSGGSDTESIHSCQGYETELAKDTSDTSSSPIYNVEYEVTDTEKEKFYLSDDSDEEEHHEEVDNILGEVGCDSLDNALLGDTSEENPTSPTSNSDADPGLPRSDYLDFEKCLMCHTERKDISYPYCSTCFAWKKNFFPTRPKKHKKKIKKDKTQSTNSVRVGEKPHPKTLEPKSNCFNGGPFKRDNNSSEDNMINDSGMGSSGPQYSQDNESSQLTQEAVRSQSSEDVIEGSQSVRDASSSQLSEDVVEGPCLSSSERTEISEDVVEGPLQELSPPTTIHNTPSTPSTSTSDLSMRKLTLDMCRVCFLKPENGLFIHTHIAHVYGCYSCAKKIWYHNGSCPICRRKIFRVAKLFV